MPLAAVKRYYSLTKPGVLFGNLITTVAGFFLATGQSHHFYGWLFLGLIAGTSLVIAAACVLNNVFDRDIDKLMTRTKKRAVAHGDVAINRATAFSIILLVVGQAILVIYVSWLVAILGLAGFVIYVWLYGAMSKRRSVHGTLVGAVSGAIPVVAGYAAASGHLDIAALLLFIILFSWQFPEFYSIAIYRRAEYRAAGIPVRPVIRGVLNTRRQIFVYTLIFVVASLALTPLGYTGWSYFVVVALMGGYWLRLASQGLSKQLSDSVSDRWAHRMFRFSLITLMSLSLLLCIGPLLP
ncbi:MAG: heme o synthase [Candidatus Saccharimonadales bacterium]